MNKLMNFKRYYSRSCLFFRDYQVKLSLLGPKNWQSKLHGLPIGGKKWVGNFLIGSDASVLEDTVVYIHRQRKRPIAVNVTTATDERQPMTPLHEDEMISVDLTVAALVCSCHIAERVQPISTCL